MKADIIGVLEEDEQRWQTCGINTAERKERYIQQMSRTNVPNPKGLPMICRCE
jgi:hypothetical protein